ncbi:MAG: nucleoside deaminase [Deltaproteobacteria bacterium]|nr:nucleoside deaminase [Deltaproteobacteria bacterium]
MKYPPLIIRLPVWVGNLLKNYPSPIANPDERMHLVVELARQNVDKGMNGPFGAAVFDETGNLIAPGINMVVGSGCSLLHAEMVALALAQKSVGRFDLSDGGRWHYQLFSSTEPCAMCLGALPWSGIGKLFCAARGEDAEAIGFDEGAKPPDWVTTLQRRGIAVERDLLRQEAVAVLRDYAARGGRIYNPVPSRG